METLAMRRSLLDRVSWGALFAGFFFGFGIWMLLLSLGAGIGLAAFDPRDLQHWQGLGIGFGIWGVISGIASMFLAAWLASRLGRVETRPGGMLHGAALWGFMLVAGLWIATMAVARTASTAAQAAGGAAQAAGQAASDPQARREAGKRLEQAQEKVQGMAQQAQANAPETAETAKKAGATGAWAFFLYGLLTLAAAMFGGRAGVPREQHLAAREEERAPPPGAPLPHRV